MKQSLPAGTIRRKAIELHARIFDRKTASSQYATHIPITVYVYMISHKYMGSYRVYSHIVVLLHGHNNNNNNIVRLGNNTRHQTHDVKYLYIYIYIRPASVQLQLLLNCSGGGTSRRHSPIYASSYMCSTRTQNSYICMYKYIVHTHV